MPRSAAESRSRVSWRSSAAMPRSQRAKCTVPPGASCARRATSAETISAILGYPPVVWGSAMSVIGVPFPGTCTLARAAGGWRVSGHERDRRPVPRPLHAAERGRPGQYLILVAAHECRPRQPKPHAVRLRGDLPHRVEEAALRVRVEAREVLPFEDVHQDRLAVG